MTDEQKWARLYQQDLPFDDSQELSEGGTQLPRFDNPKGDNQVLLQLQYRYKHGDETALTEMYKKSVEICGKFINTIAETNPHIKALSGDERKLKAQDAACYIPAQYKRDEDFYINKNFPGYLYLRVLKELFYQRKVDGIVDFVDWDTYKDVEAQDIEEEEEEENEKKFFLVLPEKNYSKRDLLRFLKCGADELEMALDTGRAIKVNGVEVTIDER